MCRNSVILAVMITKSFVVEEGEVALITFLRANIFGAGFAFCQRLLKNKDVRVNGSKVSTNVQLVKGDQVQVFYKEGDIREYKPYDLVYQDDNLLVVFKKQGIETTSDTNRNTLEALVKSEFGDKVRAGHRLDVNTEGLVIFAKNESVANQLRTGFENGYINKEYLALTFGELKNPKLTLVGYMQKDAKTGMVEIMKERRSPRDFQVKTRVEFVRMIDELSLIKVVPITGRTHQIRAHLASIGLYIVGDGKYGNTKLNNVYNKDKQCLCATKLTFAFSEGETLAYLNKKTFEVKPTFLK